MGLFKKRDVIATYKTMFGKLEVAKTFDAKGREVLIMRIDGSLQSAVYSNLDDEIWVYPPFRYIRAFDHMFEAENNVKLKINNVLMLGAGAFSYPRWILANHPSISIDVVEADPMVINIARKHFSLDKLMNMANNTLFHEDKDSTDKTEYIDGVRVKKPGISRLGIYTCDALEYLTQKEKIYDVIINDTYQGANIFQPMLDESGISAVRSRLKTNGLYMTNVSLDLTSIGARVLFNFVSALSRHFTHVNIIDACDENFGGADNYIVIASDAKYNFTDIIPY